MPAQLDIPHKLDNRFGEFRWLSGEHQIPAVGNRKSLGSHRRGDDRFA
jgi:hypothetical protein